MQVLVVFQNPDILETVSSFVQQYFGILTYEAESVDQAIAFLSDNTTEIELVVCDFDDLSKKVIAHALSHKMKLSFLCGVNAAPSTADLTRETIHILFSQKILLIQKLKITIDELLKDFIKDSDIKDRALLVVKGNALLRANPLRGNLYSQMSEFKYIRILREGAEFTTALLTYFNEKKKIRHFFIKRTDCLNFSVKILENILNQVSIIPGKPIVALPEEPDVEIIDLQKWMPSTPPTSATPPADAKEAVNEKKIAPMMQSRANENYARKIEADRLAAERLVLRTSELAKEKKAEEERKLYLAEQLEKDVALDLELIQEASRTLGFNKQVQEATRRNVMLTVKTIKKTPRLSQVLARMKKDKEKYISSHSMALAYLSCAFALQMNWPSESTFQKMTFAAFLHDITLANHELAAIKDLAELERNKSKFTEKELEAFLKHPLAAGDVARHFNEIPPDVDMIVAQHHERADGTGFPRNLPHLRIAPLSTVFIVAHDFVDFLFDSNKNKLLLDKSVIDEFLVQHQKSGQFNNFKKVLDIIPKIIA